MRVVFSAPLKPPDHPDPSGDREVARLLVAALQTAGATVEIPCRIRMLDRHGDATLTERLAAEATVAAEQYLDECRSRPPQDRPRQVFCYHLHYKAPDVFGPLVAAGLGVPYCVAEGSRAPKRAQGPWAAGHALAEAALDAASTVFVMNPRDREVLERLRPAGQRLVDLPPFLDAAAWPAAEATRRGDVPLRLLVVAMMRAGDKLASYRELAAALAQLPPDGWTLDVVGDGPARREVDSALAPFGDRVTRHGLVLDRDRLAALYAGADLLVWPAVNEAFGMVFLEAALQGCPAVAGRHGGVPGVVADGDSGVLVPGGDPAALAAAIAALIGAPQRLRVLSAGARRLAGNRDLAGAAAILREALGLPGTLPA
jgi:glycosyltransferase involved in cell wall biosynthesis